MKDKSAWWGNLGFFSVVFGYWIILSLIDRVVFAGGTWQQIENPTELLYAFLYGLKMDFSIAAYLSALPFFFFIVQQSWIKKPVSSWLLRGYVMVITFLFSAITVGNVFLYEAWGEKLSKRAISLGWSALRGVSNSIDLTMVGSAILVLVFYFFIAHYFYHLFVVPMAKFRRQQLSTSIFTFIVGIGLLFTFIRGGYGRAVLNPSSVYFSEDNTINHVAVNTYWTFLKDLTKNTKQSPYKFFTKEKACKLTSTVVTYDSHSVDTVLNISKPNIILVLLEGMVAQVFEDLGGETDVTPKMKKLMDEGISFRSAYAAADRSDKGIIATFSGFPAQGPESIIKYIPKHEKLHSITQLYDSLGYALSFYHGGQSEFYNVKSFMYTHGVNRIVDMMNFPVNTKRNSWGVYDHVVAARMLADLSKDKQPFFSIFYTLVNHEPFDLSPSYQFGNETKANAYRSTAYYTDSMLYSFIEQAKKQSWYENTIVVVTSDHGHFYPQEKYGLDNPNRYHIPLFVFGGALKEDYRGKKIDAIVSQLDIASTLAAFVGNDGRAYPYSQNLFARKRKHMAFFNSNSTFGVISSSGAVSYDVQGKAAGYSTFSTREAHERDSLLQYAQGYYQKVYDDFLKY
ncbi:MAG: LTA synthase family protein [Sphingobacterium sp.]|uniref:LTA synthase family protein n=1 Tax=Sphingobacterium sp. JB170 TaxID=1434842 RepID=UPI00097EA1E7|nr:alkaline phosphatase family protein [Sphingobacterium sp. JB170]SJN40081.1 putative sulfatase [Sphingobacterium sp. JB170]